MTTHTTPTRRAPNLRVIGAFAAAALATAVVVTIGEAPTVQLPDQPVVTSVTEQVGSWMDRIPDVDRPAAAAATTGTDGGATWSDRIPDVDRPAAAVATTSATDGGPTWSDRLPDVDRPSGVGTGISDASAVCTTTAAYC